MNSFISVIARYIDQDSPTEKFYIFELVTTQMAILGIYFYQVALFNDFVANLIQFVSDEGDNLHCNSVS